METGEVPLPDDVLFNIFSKLALQNPPSLLAASSACRNFYSVVSSHPSLWQSAFYSLSEPAYPLDSEAAAFQDILNQVGGYKSLVRARWAKQTPAPNKTNSACFEESLMKLKLGSQYKMRLLVFLRTTQGRLCLYGEGQASCNWGSDTFIYVTTSHLRPLFPTRSLPMRRPSNQGVFFRLLLRLTMAQLLIIPPSLITLLAIGN